MVLFFDVYEEKESIVLELINGEESSYSILRKYSVSRSLLWTLVETYRNEDIKFARATKPTKGLIFQITYWRINQQSTIEILILSNC